MSCIEWICKTKKCTETYQQNERPMACDSCLKDNFSYIYDEPERDEENE